VVGKNEKKKKQHQTESLETARTESQSGQPNLGHHQRYEEERTTCPASKGKGGEEEKRKEKKGTIGKAGIGKERDIKKMH